MISGGLGFWQEYGAADAVKKLLSIVQTKSTVVRSGSNIEIPTNEIVSGDVIILTAGNMIPGDSLLIELGRMRS